MITVSRSFGLFASARRRSSSRPAALLILALLPTLALLCGCGGGGVGGSSNNSNGAITLPTPTPAATIGTPSGPYTPNYRSDINALRHWGVPVVTVSFLPPPPDVNGNVRNMQPFIQQAINNWNAKVSGSVMLQLVSGPATTGITISFVSSGSLPDGAIGRTEVTFTNLNQILQLATVKIDQNLSDDFETQVITHELGHALGIDGHSTDPNDLMFARAHLPTAITARDMDTILLAYNGGADRAAAASQSRRVAADALETTASYSCAELGWSDNEH